MTISDETISLLNDMARILREATMWLGRHDGEQMQLGREANAVLDRYDAWKAKQ